MAAKAFWLSYSDAFAFFPSASTIIALDDAGESSCTPSFAGR